MARFEWTAVHTFLKQALNYFICRIFLFLTQTCCCCHFCHHFQNIVFSLNQPAKKERKTIIVAFSFSFLKMEVHSGSESGSLEETNWVSRVNIPSFPLCFAQLQRQNQNTVCDYCIETLAAVAADNIGSENIGTTEFTVQSKCWWWWWWWWKCPKLIF